MQSTTSPQSLHVNSPSTSPHINSSSTSPPSKRIANPYIKRSKEGKQVRNDSLYDDLYGDLSTPNSKKLNVDVVTESPSNRSDSNNLKRQSNKQPTIISTKLNFDNSINDQAVKTTSKTKIKTLHQSSSKTRTLFQSSKSTEPKLDLFAIDWSNSNLLRQEIKKYDPSKKTQEDIITLILNESSLQSIKVAFAILVGQSQTTYAFMPFPLQRNKVMENFMVLIYNLKSMIVDDTEHEYW